MSINDKIKQVLTIKNLSPSYLADDIGVQRSSISHILSGRNRPSLDIIQKIVRRFPEFTYEWFLEEDIQMSTQDEPTVEKKVSKPVNERLLSRSTYAQSVTPDVQPTEEASLTTNENETIIPKSLASSKAIIDRILIFYKDGTFREFTPA